MAVASWPTEGQVSELPAMSSIGYYIDLWRWRPGDRSLQDLDKWVVS